MPHSLGTVSSWVALLVWPASAVAQAASADDARKVSFSGFVTSSYVYATGANGDAIPGRLYDRFQDEFYFNAAKLVAELAVPTDRLEAGFRIDALLGQNAQFTQAAGFDLGQNGDILQGYVVLNLPTGKDRYLQFKAGKLATLIGLEVMEDVVNPNFSIGNQFLFLENFTNTGIGVDLKLAAAWDAQLRVFNGWDVVKDNNEKKSFMGRLAVMPGASTVLAVIGYVGPEQAGNDDNNRYGVEFTLTQKLGSATAVWVELDFGKEEAARLDGDDASWWGGGVWLTHDLTGTLGLAVRGDYVGDKDGARSTGNFLGAQTDLEHNFGSLTATLNWRPVKSLLLRPEIRYDSSNQDVFDGDQSQLSFQAAVSYLF